MSEKDKLTASRAAAPPAASHAAPPHASAAAAAGDSSDNSCEEEGESSEEEEEGCDARVLDTSAGIPDGMSKAEWKKKVKEEKREKRKTKIPVRVCCCFGCFWVVFAVQCFCCVSDRPRRNI